MITVEQYLTGEGKSIVKEIQDNLASTRTDATGKTSKSLKSLVDSVIGKITLVVKGRGFFKVVETGRGPRKSTSRSDFFNNFLEWMSVRGVGNELDARKRMGLARFLIWKINKEGSALFKKGGRKDIFSNVITEGRIQKIREHIKSLYKDAIVKSLTQAVQ